MKRKFLGFQLNFGGLITIADQSIERLKKTIKAATKRNRGRSLEEIIKELNTKLSGWIQYFKIAQCKELLKDLDSWIRRKLRCYRLKQFKRKYTIARSLTELGVKEWQAWILALSGKGWWRLSATPQLNQAMNNSWFKEKGLVSLLDVYMS